MDFSASITALSTAVLLALPRIFGALVILIIGAIVALILESVTGKLLRRTGLDDRLVKSPGHNIVRKLTNSPSLLIAKVVYWLIMIITITIAITALNVPIFNQFLAGIYSYIPNIIAAIIILALALAVSTAIAGIAVKLMGDTPTGKIVSIVVPVIILSIAGFAILEQLKIAPTIVTITYAALVGSLALGFALAFGLGGREVAGKLFEQAYKSGRDNMGQIKNDFQKGKERGEDEKRHFENENR